MQRTIGRAYKRLRGAHPRRPKLDFSPLAEIACDARLAWEPFVERLSELS